MNSRRACAACPATIMVGRTSSSNGDREVRGPAWPKHTLFWNLSFAVTFPLASVGPSCGWPLSGETAMKKMIACLLLAGSLGACNSYNSTDRAVAGGLIGAGTGAWWAASRRAGPAALCWPARLSARPAAPSSARRRRPSAATAPSAPAAAMTSTAIAFASHADAGSLTSGIVPGREPEPAPKKRIPLFRSEHAQGTDLARILFVQTFTPNGRRAGLAALSFPFPR